MTVVIDANIVVALVLPLPYSDEAVRKVTTWQQSGVELYAPLLIDYEITTVLRRATVAGLTTQSEMLEILRHISHLDIRRVLPDLELQASALEWAGRLGQAKTYDACYLAVAEQLRADLWTADRRLVNGARQAGVSWVRWIGEEPAGKR